MKWFLAAVAVLGLSVGSGLLIAAALAPHPHAQIVRLPEGQTIDTLAAYDTMNEAAIYAAVRLYKCSHVYECGGVIAQRPDGKFVPGPLVSSYAGDHVGFGRGAPLGYKVVGTIHSHPCLADSHEPDYFSPDDMVDVITHKEAGYMLNECSGELHLLTPTNIRLERLPESDRYVPKGEIVGKIPVDGESVEPVTGFEQ